MSSALPSQSAVFTPQRVRGQHDGQLQLDGLLEALRFNLELQQNTDMQISISSCHNNKIYILKEISPLSSSRGKHVEAHPMTSEKGAWSQSKKQLTKTSYWMRMM